MSRRSDKLCYTLHPPQLCYTEFSQPSFLNGRPMLHARARVPFDNVTRAVPCMSACRKQGLLITQARFDNIARGSLGGSLQCPRSVCQYHIHASSQHLTHKSPSKLVSTSWTIFRVYRLSLNLQNGRARSDLGALSVCNPAYIQTIPILPRLRIERPSG